MTTIAYDAVTVAGEGVTLERMLWRRDRQYTPGLAELALSINPGLAALGPILPVGTDVRLPTLASLPSDAAEPTVIRLFD